MEESIDTNKFLGMLKELINNQVTITKCDVQQFSRETREQIAECAHDVYEDLTAKAKMYGVQMNKIAKQYENEKSQTADILSEYRKAIGDVAKPFDEEMKAVMVKESDAKTEFIALAANFIPNFAKVQGQNMKMDLETKKQTANVLTAIAKGDYKKAIEGLENVKQAKENKQPEAVKTLAKSVLEQMKSKLELIEECRREKEDIRNRRNEKINSVKAQKNNALAKVQKQNMVQRIMGSLFSKFNGTKKFMKNAVDPLKDKISEIRNTHIPNINAEISKRMEDFKVKFENKRASLEEAVAQKVDQYAEKLAMAKEGVKNNIETAKNMLSGGIKDAVETAKIEAMIANDFITDKIDDIKSFGNGVQESAKAKIQEAKDWGADKIETAQIYGMLAKDKVLAGKDAILQGAVNIRDGVVQSATNVRDGAVQMAADVRDGAVQMATGVRNGVVNTAVSARNLIVKGVSSVGEAGKTTYKSLINMGLQARMNILTSMQRKLDEQQKEIQEKMNNLNPTNNKNGGELEFA